MDALEANADFGGVGLLAPVDDLQDGIGELALLIPDEVSGDGDRRDGDEVTVEGDTGRKENGAVSEAKGPQAGPSGQDNVNGSEDPKVLVEVMLGKTVIGPPSAWEGEMESALPFIERSVAISDEYESALVDEDIIVGLKVSRFAGFCSSVSLF